MRKKGQFRISENMIVIFFVVFLLLILFIGFVEYNSYSVKKKAFELKYNEIEQLLSIIPVMPEFGCSLLGVVDEACMDTSKFNYGFSEGYFGDGLVIKVEEVLLNGREWTLYDNKDDDYDDVYKLSSFVSLYYPGDKYYGIGLLRLEWYQ